MPDRSDRASAASPRRFLPWSDRRLHMPAQPVVAVTETVRMIWDEMTALMEAMPGVGLAAPQIGIMLQLAVVDASTRRGQVVRMANPRILHSSTRMRAYDEASPNLPGVSAVISRPRAVTVQFVNDMGEEEERDFVGLWATSVQHQIDHLHGRLYVDHLSPLKRRMLVAKSQKGISRKGKG